MKTIQAVLLPLLCIGLGLIAAESGMQNGAGGATSAEQQTCQPDIHTVLREMSTQLAEQRVELRHTQAQLETMEKKAETMEKKAETMEKKAETMEARLRDSEGKAETMEARLRNSEKTVEEQRVALRQAEARLSDTERYVEQLKSVNQAQVQSLNLTGRQVEELRMERQNRRVSFSAALQTTAAGQHTGPFSVATPLVYRHVFTNIGEAYNPNTGVFTAPVRGVYMFFVFLHAGGHASNNGGVTLHKNGDHVVIASAHQTSHSVNPSNGVSLLLEVGDVVYVKLWPNSWVWDSYAHHTTFSGHLLFPM
ncbi:heavy metal-binding protein HIP-like [Engraulis encrasicolus]|uniref:heavy metal-binding protein HIP-like n=1 Tax=Engraulis encrasicolus TaxID=184585 RepID=UPI002FD26310